MEDDRTFFRVGGVCAALSGVTTFLLWLLPRTYDAPAGFEESIALHAHAGYMARWWVNFVHIFLALAGYAATAWALRARSRMLSALGFLWFLLWGFTELLGVSIHIWAVNRTWRAGWAAADAATRDILRANLTGFSAVWDGMFFLLLVAFLLGTLCFGIAAVSGGSGIAAARGSGLERWVGAMLLLAVPLTIAILLDGYAGMTAAGRAVERIYPVLQPVSRVSMGVWLWRRTSAYHFQSS
ncbi:MAG TPA: hypothetical protein VFD06_02945 [Candidatus Polarisedimenticolia bacterium]|nr:hypothetical protein [Candidatus Polarisedimenticolia bacterium]